MLWKSTCPLLIQLFTPYTSESVQMRRNVEIRENGVKMYFSGSTFSLSEAILDKLEVSIDSIHTFINRDVDKKASAVLSHS